MYEFPALCRKIGNQDGTLLRRLPAMKRSTRVPRETSALVSGCAYLTRVPCARRVERRGRAQRKQRAETRVSGMYGALVLGVRLKSPPHAETSVRCARLR